MSNIRSVSIILQVVRCFEDPDIVHVENTVDPVRDIDTIQSELVLSGVKMQCIVEQVIVFLLVHSSFPGTITQSFTKNEN